MGQETFAATTGMSGTHKRLLMLSLAMCTFLSNLLLLAFAPFLPAMARELGTTISLVGQVPASITLVASALALVFGPIADRAGYRRFLLLALASLVVCALFISLSTTLILLFGAAIFGVLSRAITLPVSQAIAGECFVDADRRRALSWITAGLSGAMVIGVPVLTSVDAVLGWHGAFAALALIAVVNLVLVARVVPGGVPQSPRGGGLDIGGVLAGYRAVGGHRPTLGLLLSFALAMIGWFSILAYLGAFFIETYGFDTQQAGLIFLAVGVGILAGSLATGGRLGARPLRPLLIGCRLIIIPLVGLTVLLPMPAIAAAALLVTLGFLFAVCNVSTVSLLAAETRAGRATTMAVFSTASNVGLGVGSALGGLLLSFSGYPMLGLEAMALCGASVGVLWWLRPMSVSEDSKV